jgi:hypothetical protein
MNVLLAESAMNKSNFDGVIGLLPDDEPPASFQESSE